jgi:transmembrane sensor
MAEFNTPEDFFESDQFREWVRCPNSENSAYWKEWLERNPSQRHVFETAVAMLALLEGNTIELSDKYIHRKVAGLKENLVTPGPARQPVFPGKTQFIRWAALIVLTAGLGWLLIKREAPSTESTALSTAKIAEPVKTFSNKGNQPLLINLPDGSSVVLSSGSRIDYETPDGSFGRKVRLTGEGFFEVVKDPANPFYVYTAHLVTRVLGTSFLVRSFDNEPKATVTVRTGTVSVTSRKPGDSQRDPREETLLLKPNELVSLVVATDEMIRGKWSSQHENPLPEPLQQPKYEFLLTPVIDVFTLLEKAYGVSIQYEAEKLKNCTLTATLSDEPFLDKIRMICIGIEADFRVNGNQVVITGSGCGTPDQ